MHAELEKETGHKVASLRPVFNVFMSPGSVTERLHFLRHGPARPPQLAVGLPVLNANWAANARL